MSDHGDADGMSRGHYGIGMMPESDEDELELTEEEQLFLRNEVQYHSETLTFITN